MRTLTLALVAILVAQQNFTQAAGPTTAPSKLNGKQPTELALDDGKSAGKLSIAGSGHAVVFQAPSDDAMLVGVKIFGYRYGTQQPPNEDFKVWLCQDDGKPIKEFAFPYKSFARGETHWVKLTTEPTPVPKKVMICVGFNPEQTKGIYVHYDKSTDGDSRTGLPEVINEKFTKGDWMIRALMTSSKGSAPAPAKQQ